MILYAREGMETDACTHNGLQFWLHVASSSEAHVQLPHLLGCMYCWAMSSGTYLSLHEAGGFGSLLHLDRSRPML